MSIILTCHKCNKEYTNRPSRINRSKYCSRVCHAQATIAIKKISSIKCVGCTKIITGSPGKLKNRKYCSVLCRAITYGKTIKDTKSKEHNRYKNGIGIYRKLALDFYGQKCMNCNDVNDIEVHHIDQNRKNNEITNLKVLCSKCHHKEHRKYNLEKICPICNIKFDKPSRPKMIYCSRKCYYVKISKQIN